MLTYKTLLFFCFFVSWVRLAVGCNVARRVHTEQFHSVITNHNNDYQAPAVTALQNPVLNPYIRFFFLFSHFVEATYRGEENGIDDHDTCRSHATTDLKIAISR